MNLSRIFSTRFIVKIIFLQVFQRVFYHVSFRNSGSEFFPQKIWKNTRYRNPGVSTRGTNVQFLETRRTKTFNAMGEGTQFALLADLDSHLIAYKVMKNNFFNIFTNISLIFHFSVAIFRGLLCHMCDR